jgi:adenosylhomocysteine nucleosidase
MKKTAIIAALDRELHPFVDGWIQTRLEVSGKSLSCYECQDKDAVAVAGGIGCERSAQAARAVVAKYQPKVLISAGLAGALIRSLKVASIVTPNVIVDAASGAEYRCQMGGDVVGGGVLVSSQGIASTEAKAGLVERCHALVVDMEAAGVARVAEETGTGFRCVKAISDELDFALPPLERFVDSEGAFQTARFAAWAVLRPWRWVTVIQLARNSTRATKALSAWLEKNLGGSLVSATVVTLNGAEHFDSCARRPGAGGMPV